MELRAEDITFRYAPGEKPVLEHVNFSVKSGERVALLAPSGFGKSTLAKILAGYLTPEQGSVLREGRPLPPEGHVSGAADSSAPGAGGESPVEAKAGAGGVRGSG